MAEQRRADRTGQHRTAFDKNRRRVLASQTVCGICGKPVDFSLKYPHPLSPCVDHIIPVARGGHPSDMSNLQLAHWCCNRQKSDKLQASAGNYTQNDDVLSNRILPHSIDWRRYKG